MKYFSNFILILIFSCAFIQNSKSLILNIPDDMARFTPNIDNYQTTLRYYQLLNNLYNINKVANPQISTLAPQIDPSQIVINYLNLAFNAVTFKY
jgi:hypothetical protein